MVFCIQCWTTRISIRSNNLLEQGIDSIDCTLPRTKFLSNLLNMSHLSDWLTPINSHVSFSMSHSVVLHKAYSDLNQQTS